MLGSIVTCPQCGAALPQAAAGVVSCQYCGTTFNTEQQPRAARGDTASTSPAQAPSLLWRRLGLVATPLLALAGGAVAAQTVFVCLRNGYPEPLPVAVCMGVISLSLAVAKRTLLAIVAASWSGVLLAIKPLVWPVYMQSGTVFDMDSETHLTYLIAGAALLCLAILIAVRALSVRSSRSISLARHALHCVAIAAGVAVTIPLYAGATTAEVLDRFRPRLDQVRATWAELHAQLPPPGSVTAEPPQLTLDPPPVVRGWPNDEQTNTEIVASHQLRYPEDKPDFDLLLGNALVRAVLWAGPHNPLSPSVLYGQAGGMGQDLEAALGYSYLLVYRRVGAGGGPEAESASAKLELFLFDRSTSDRLIAFRLVVPDDWSDARQQLGWALEQATGGRFELD